MTSGEGHQRFGLHALGHVDDELVFRHKGRGGAGGSAHVGRGHGEDDGMSLSRQAAAMSAGKDHAVRDGHAGKFGMAAGGGERFDLLQAAPTTP